MVAVLSRNKVVPLLALGLAVASVLAAGHARAANERDQERIADAMKKMLGGRAELNSVKPTPVPGLYEVSIGSGIVYTDASARYVINGALIDTKTGVNLTEARVGELNRISWSSLPMANAMKWTKGNGSRQIAVFSDPNCPYCKKLEQTLQQLDNVTVYTFLFPVLSPDSETKAKRIWCSTDKVQAWQDWMLSKVAPKGKTTCKTPVEENIALGLKLNVTGTPGVFFADGSRLSGAADAAAIEQKLVDIAKK
ncbi:DsbC family protein [Cupriavidus campinensis]|uniref:Thiol:disulfide interchange protein n=1 Tax=Cupriavidus campinensis TaxID=151783 RepID=A0ABY3EE52_9BURK|nr:DsbC family protein [Cupriavidus campinensis]TSP09189.1 DsbC family protein [Cupriavidus campinensis]